VSTARAGLRAAPAASASARRWPWPSRSGPDLLLLDEPTNHLDIDGIEQLEADDRRRGARQPRGDRHHARPPLPRPRRHRIVELDRGALHSYPGNFTQFEARKQKELQAEATARRRFDRFWAQEEAWIRKGIEARRTRNAGRVTRLQTLRSERAARRERIGTAKLALDAGSRSGKLVAELRGVSKSFGGRAIVRELDLDHPARRPAGADRAQRRRQEHAAQVDPRRTGAGCRHG
jgi:ABC transport system ATP-binding/permease protein